MGDESNILRIDKAAKYQNVCFNDQHDTHEYEVGTVMDPTRTMADLEDATLDKFFSRPIKIHTEEWGTGTNLYFSIDPWALYFENPRVINRITNYELLKAKLKLKLVINGNGFQYGRAIASYLPYVQYDPVSTNAGAVLQDVVQASQLPHVFLDPTTSMGGELTLPFFFHENYMRISRSDWQVMGDLTVRSINALKHANGASDKVTVSVFAWAEDVQMSVLTSVDPTTLVPQSGNEDEVDEANRQGFISGPATTVAKVASFAAKVPVVAPFATATELAASTVAEIARIFGYSRPNIVADPNPFKPSPISSLAVCNTPDNSGKLTVDAKQELSVDTRIAGLSEFDPLNIASIASRESYLTTFSWVMNTAPETLLWNARVSPVIWAENGLTPKGYHFPPCAMAAMPFKYWSGSMTFRFQIVCSAFHKGRLKIVYDPNYLGSNEYNTNYIEIVDIAENNDFSITVGAAQSVSLLEHHTPGVDSVTQLYSTTPYASKEAGNGVIGVYIVNELTTPNSVVNNDIEINVYVKMNDDFEVYVPEEKTFTKFVVKPQSGEEIVPESLGEANIPVTENSKEIVSTTSNHPLLNKVYTGECIKSFRTLLKRYNLHSGYGTANTGDRIITLTRNAFPFFRGNVPGAVHTTNTLAPYNYCNTILLHWITMGFTGYRGSFRWKLLPLTENQNAMTYNVTRIPATESSASYSDLDTILPVFTSVSDAAYISLDGTYANHGHNGVVYQNAQVNPNLEFEMPFYLPYRFNPSKQIDYTSVNASNTEDWRCDIHMHNTTASDWLGMYVAVGEDFQVYFWTGLPRMYYEASPPVP